MDGQNRTPERPIWEPAFLATLGRTGNVWLSCRTADVPRSVVYDRRRNYPEFKAAWREALQNAADLLEAEARRRAEAGVERPVIHRGQLSLRTVDAEGRDVPPGTEGAQHIPLTVRRYSDPLMVLLLKGAKKRKYRDRSETEFKGRIEQDGLLDLSKLSEEELETFERLRRKATHGEGDSGGEGTPPP